MNKPFAEVFPEFRALLDALCEETIAAEQVKRLEELVLAYPEAEAFYVQFMALHAELVRRFGALPAVNERLLLQGAVPETAVPTVPMPMALVPTTVVPATVVPAAVVRRRWPRMLGWGAGLSAAAAGLLIYVSLPARQGLRYPKHPPAASSAVEAIDRTVAVLVQAPGAVWEESDMPTRAGAPLSPGWLRLKSGSAQVEFYNGARVILQGPAEFKLISRTEAYCASGKLRAMVPPQAVGFTIGSPKLDVVDLGTEFGLDVAAGGHTEVHVFQGKVQLHDPKVDRQAARQAPAGQELVTGQSVRLEGAGMVQSIKPNPAGFLTAQGLAERVKDEIQRKHKDWLAATAELRKDPTLLVHYTFQSEDAWSRTLRDRASERDEARDGAIVGCAWAGGRWPGKQGLEFKRVSDRVRFHVPGEFDSITLAAWLRVDALQNRNNAFMMVDGWEPGGLHWQSLEDGTLVLGVQSKPKGRGGHYHAPEVLTPERLGQWIHLSVVYDQGNSLVTHYLDGRPVAQEPVVFDIPLRVGEAELGNWNVAKHRNNTPIRNLNGAMDEFTMFSRALGEEEIQRLYAQGRPPL